MVRFKIIIVFLLSCIQIAMGQDTLWYKNHTTEIVKLIEVGVADIRYKRFRHLDGPDMVRPLSDLKKIRLSNGDILNFNNNSENNSTPRSFAYNYSPIEILDQKMYHKNRPIGEGVLFRLIQNAPNIEGKNEMLNDFAIMKKHKKKQLKTFFIGGGIGLYVTGMSALIGIVEQEVIFAGTGALGLTTLITSTLISTNNKTARYEKRSQIIDRYNSLIARHAAISLEEQ